jgi:hypothetical protein
MIDTSSLKDGDICLVDIQTEDGHTHMDILCIFIQGGFQNIEDKFTYQVHGSNVADFEKIQTAVGLEVILQDKIRTINGGKTGDCC